VNLPHKPSDQVIKYKDLEEIDIKCADCEEDLFKLLRVACTSKKNKLIVECPFCDGRSWTVEVEGDYFQAPPDDLIVYEVYEKDGIIVIELEGKDDGSE
tara:strand:+ start:10357 stop:10653 length:297 start_codon:yes stop_codon:yes gene_type:complete